MSEEAIDLAEVVWHSHVDTDELTARYGDSLA